MLPRLIATDFDGTLTDGTGRVPSRTTALLARLGSMGIPVVVATGRCLGGLAPVLAAVPTDAPVVCGNGALVIDPVTGRTLAEWLIPPATLAEQTDRLRARLPGLRFGAEREAEFVHEAGYPAPAHGPRRQIREVSTAELVSLPVPKLVARWPGEPDADHHELIGATVAGQLNASYSGTYGLAELSAPHVTKASGLAWVAARLGVAPGDVIAFGDMPNDLPMLRWAGQGVAVAWAHPAVLDEMTTRTPDGGVAAYLTAMLENTP
ncbi:hydroxymethylpyrimidine pyrophosphatase-like HAD family hydrolase [Allocatelliglobosispora scoriae]|uniref:Hydroxymethylpyrimidine pyrophosphatase-like HAD family hydrolase n=1 Tax=Allocatelliglobosispora scoriae TaxID=643052 RepID=A0A841BN75_9ACTN|nr:HAD family hydrolase [Allocatelliglobosispora scoriae]MBB5868736.1 hydroxymethylpyrimidine pyrophosphatase-like HAD family hydrolase [Allocatelliglobosispora scoriae]